MRNRAARLAGGLVDPASRLPNALAALFVVVLTVVVVHNAFTYPSVSGFEAEADIAYAHAVVEHWRIPTELTNNYYTPPGFFLLGGAMIKLGEALGVDEPAHLGQLLNGLLTVGSAILLAVLCAIVFPGRPWLRCAALGLFVSLPVVLKTGAMFHPEPLVAFLALLATVLAARMIAVGRYRLWSALVLGVVLGAGQLVRSAGIWELGVVCIALLATAIARPSDRRPALRALVVSGVVGVLVAAPWYIHLQTTFSNPIFGRSSLPATTHLAPALVPGRSAAPAAFRLAAAARIMPSQRLWFYADPELEATFESPWRSGLTPAYWPITYTETWGDYYGVWKWGSVQKPLSPSTARRLKLQSAIGVLPTFLAASGFVALLVLAVAGLRRRPELLLVPLMPLAALAGTMYYAHSYPTVDGDTVKALFVLPALPALALCFGFTLDVIGRASRWVALALAVPLIACGLVALSFGIL